MKNYLVEVRSCPCCGSTSVSLCKSYEKDCNVRYAVGYVRCRDCGLQTEHLIIDGYYGATTTMHDVIERWNRRDDTRQIIAMNPSIDFFK